MGVFDFPGSGTLHIWDHTSESWEEQSGPVQFILEKTSVSLKSMVLRRGSFRTVFASEIAACGPFNV